MNSIIIRTFIESDINAVLKLNQESVSVLSPMSKERFSELKSMAKVIWVAEKQNEIIAFLMGFTNEANYDSVNYQWFCKKLKNFIYIDRIVVSAGFRSVGIGKAFYEKLEKWAEENRFTCLAAEIDIEPANDGSLKFHKKHGFIEIGRQTIKECEKTVSLQMKRVKN